jgi:hypothetical protein
LPCHECRPHIPICKIAFSNPARTPEASTLPARFTPQQEAHASAVQISTENVHSPWPKVMHSDAALDRFGKSGRRSSLQTPTSLHTRFTPQQEADISAVQISTENVHSPGSKVMHSDATLDRFGKSGRRSSLPAPTTLHARFTPQQEADTSAVQISTENVHSPGQR